MKGKTNISIILTGGFGFCAFLIVWGSVTNNNTLIDFGLFLGLLLVFTLIKER